MKTTPLLSEHEKLGAKMCPFAGYNMPIQYADGILKEHEWVRSHCGIFDVSHMGQWLLSGKDAAVLLSRLTPSDFTAVPVAMAKYSVFTNDKGGILDDLIAARLEDQVFFVVVNAGCKDQDAAWVKKNLANQPGGDVKLELLETRALIAVQGPEAEAVVKALVKGDVAGLGYMRLGRFALKDGTDVIVSRTGYTGEDGFEVSLPNSKAAGFWNELLKDKRVKPIGLGARDSLRLEAGYPLYGHDLNEETSPVEAGISWVIGKANDNFIGHDRVLKEKAAGATRKRVGVMLKDKGIVREGAKVLSSDGKELGSLSSGGFSPTLKASIGMAYVPANMAKPGTAVQVELRGKALAAEITAMPFVPYRTKK